MLKSHNCVTKSSTNPKTSLKPQRIILNLELAAANGTGEQVEQRQETSCRNYIRSHPGRTRTHQITLEHIKKTCSIIRGSTEAAKSQKCYTKSINLTYLTWTCLKPQQITSKTKLPGRTAPVNKRSNKNKQVAEIKPVHTQDAPKHIRTHLELTRTHLELT